MAAMKGRLILTAMAQKKTDPAIANSRLVATQSRQK